MSEKFRTKFSKRQRVQTIIDDLPSETNQQWKDETNINYIIKNCTPDSLNYQLKLADSQLAFGEMIDAGQQTNIMFDTIKQKNAFNALPADVRKAYNYDFKTFLIQSSTDEGIEKMVDLNLLPKSYSKIQPVEDDETTVQTTVNADKSDQISNL